MDTSMKRAWLGVAVAAAIFAHMGPASAATALILEGPIVGNTQGPQSTSNPCVIAGTQCSQPEGTFTFGGVTKKMPFNNFDQNADSIDKSQTYLLSELRAAVGDIYNVAIDVNTTEAASETLELFEIYRNALLVYEYIGPTNIADVENNGNGWADWLLKTVDTSTWLGTDTITFHAVLTGAVDGAESFFLIPVPFGAVGGGLSGLVLACGALLALGRRRRQRLA